MIDGDRVVPWLPFVRCWRCASLCAEQDGLALPHATPCGSVCSLSSNDDSDETCDGWCSVCMKARTGCDGDPDKPCGVPGCSQCGVHIDPAVLGIVTVARSGSACGMARPVARFAWVMSRVTCGACAAAVDRMKGSMAAEAPTGAASASRYVVAFARSAVAYDLTAPGPAAAVEKAGAIEHSREPLPDEPCLAHVFDGARFESFSLGRDGPRRAEREHAPVPDDRARLMNDTWKEGA